jgi:hypothetical protein
MDNSRLESSYTSSLINGLSEHDAQFLKTHNICAPKNKNKKKEREREKERKEKTNKQDTLTTFQILQQQETWESVYQKQDTNCMYNIFLSTFLIILSKTRY